MNRKEVEEVFDFIDKELEKNNFISKVIPRGTDEAKVIQVIKTKSLIGKGTNDDPCRYINQYWDLEGNFLAEQDSYD